MSQRDLRVAARVLWSSLRSLSVSKCSLLVTLVFLLGCAPEEKYVWAQSVPRPPVAPTAAYVIDAGDTLDIRVFGEDRLSVHPRVRLDGRITVPLLGEIDARGKVPAVLAAELQTRLQQYIKEPTVTIAVDETHLLNIVVLGEVTRPGVVQVPQQAGMLAVLALVGGFTENADQDAIFLLRQRPPMRVRFTYHTLTSVDGIAAATFPLQNGDVVTVE